ncbi:MAG: SDR family oxidoreductase [Anaerolineales bacterium]|nr:SDR family oxidoreductase [Anaerolineales bacterium]
MDLKNPYDLLGKAAVLTGGAGVLCSTMARGLSACGAKTAILDINLEAAKQVAAQLRESGGEAIAIKANVLDKASIEEAANQVIDAFGRVDILINGAGGNKKEATTGDELSFFDLPADAIRWVFELNCIGTVLPSQVFGRHMAEQGSGCIVNISSMAALRPLTRTAAYSPAKAAVSNFTQWLAVHMSQNHSTKIRVNAIAPGFFLTEQNRFLLVNEASGDPSIVSEAASGQALTERGRTIIDHTPIGRFGDPEDLIGVVLWLLSDGASFVHGAVIPIDGGFSAFSGV